MQMLSSPTISLLSHTNCHNTMQCTVGQHLPAFTHTRMFHYLHFCSVLQYASPTITAAIATIHVTFSMYTQTHNKCCFRPCDYTLTFPKLLHLPPLRLLQPYMSHSACICEHIISVVSGHATSLSLSLYYNLFLLLHLQTLICNLLLFFSLPTLSHH